MLAIPTNINQFRLILRGYEMTKGEKETIKLQLNEAIVQLQQALKYIHQERFVGASIFVGNAQNILPVARMKLAGN